eukprot:5980563-Pyramimonas_sp.AAC.1
MTRDTSRTPLLAAPGARNGARAKHWPLERRAADPGSISAAAVSASVHSQCVGRRPSATSWPL